MPQSLAKLIKAKYPGVYDDMDDKTLDSSIRAKYPGQYDDIPSEDNSSTATTTTDAPKSGFLGRLKETASGLKDLAVNLGPSAAKFISNPAAGIANAIKDPTARDTLTRPFKQVYEDPMSLPDQVGIPVKNLKEDWKNRDFGGGAFDLGMTGLTLLGAREALKGGRGLPQEDLPVDISEPVVKPGIRALLPEKAGTDFISNPEGVSGRPNEFHDFGFNDFRDRVNPQKPGTNLSPFDQLGRSDVAELPVRLPEEIPDESSRFNSDKFKTKAIGINTRIPGSIFDTVPDRVKLGPGPFDPEPMNLAPDTAVMPRDIKVENPGSEVNLDTSSIPDREPSQPTRQLDRPDRIKEVKTEVARKLDSSPTPITPEQVNQVIKNVGKRNPWKEAYDSVGTSVSTQIKNLGGEELSKLLDDTETEAAAYSGKLATEVRKARRGLNEAEQAQVVKVLDGQIPYASVTNPKVANAYGRLRAVFNTLGKDAESSGVNLRSRGETLPFKMMEGEYFPHQYPKGFWADKESLVNRLIKAGKSPEQAKTIVENSHKFGEKFLAPQHARELNLPGYIEDLNVPERYIYDMGRKIKVSERLGAKDIADPESPVSQLIAKTSDPEKVRNLLEGYFNRGPIPEGWQSHVANAVTKAEVAAHMSLFAIQNLGDLASIPVRAGLKNFIKAAHDTIRDPHLAGDKASDSGAYAILRKEALKDVDSGDLLSKAYGIAPIEKTIRTIGSLAGRASAQDLFIKAKGGSKVAKSRLQDLIKDPVSEVIKQESLTPEQIDFAGGRAVELTSGVPNKLSLPPAFTEGNPALRLALLFKRFAFINTKNLTEVISKEPTVAGKVAKLTAALAAYQVAGEGVGDLKAAVKSLVTQNNEIVKRGSNSPVSTGNDTADRIIANFMQSFFFGLIGDVAENTAHGKSGLLSIIGGPAASDAGNLIEAGIGAAKGRKGEEKTGLGGNKYNAPYQGNRFKALEKFAARQVPFFGSGLAARLDEGDKNVKPKFR